MPANLTPMYRKAERDYRRAQTAAEQVDCLQVMLQLIPKHKGTDRLQADLKSRLSDAKQSLKQQLNAPKGGQTYRFPRQGAGRIVIVGGPNAGKSRLLKELTRADPDVAPFPFTTHEPLPAIMDFDGVQIQLIDTPPVVSGKLEPWLLNLVRTADGVLLAFDGSSDDAPEDTATVVREFGNRKTRFTEVGGFDGTSYSIVNVATLLVLTHAGDADSAARRQLFQELETFTVPFAEVELKDSAQIGVLKQHCFDLLGLIRVFTKPPGQAADLSSPLTVAKNGTVESLALQIHEDLGRNLKHAKIWGEGGHDGQIVGREHVLREGDVVELH